MLQVYKKSVNLSGNKMVGVSQIAIRESRETLKALMREQVTISARERIHSLYLLKSREARGVGHAAQILCRSRVTLQRWMKKYQLGDIAQLLAPPTGQGRKSKVPASVAIDLVSQLDTETGFGGYGEVQDWLADRGVTMTAGVHYYVYHGLGASLKVPRPRSQAQDPVRVELFKTLLLLN
jgi:transposase